MALVPMSRVRQTYKARDSWWTVLLVDSVAGHLVRLAAPRAWITPTRLTVTAFLLGVAAAVAFWQASPAWWITGAVLYHLAFTVDCVDGKLARLRDQRSMVGSWLDFLLDRVRVLACAAALLGGLHRTTGDDVFLYALVGVVFLSLVFYLNGAETDRVRALMAARSGGVAAVGRDGEAGSTAGPRAADTPVGAPVAGSSVGAPVAGPQAGARAALPAPGGAAGGVVAWLHRHRIRANLVSAIEFEMALFVIAPPVAAAAGGRSVLAVALGAAALLLCFEAMLMARFVVAARSFDRAATTTVRLPAPRAATVAGESAAVDAATVDPSDRRVTG